MTSIIAFAFLWFLSGYLSTLLVSRLINLPFSPLQFGLMNMLIGLIALVPKLQSGEGRRMFYHGPDVDEDGDVTVGCLWVIPVQILLFTVIGFGVWLALQGFFN